MKAQLGTTPFAVIDVETTGLRPGGHDRIIEVAVLRYQPDTHVLEDEFVSLVNPHRDLGRVDIHGITSEELRHAPAFAEISGDLSAILSGTILVGHNIGFDLAFLRAEYDRLGAVLPTFPSICTLQLACQLPDPPGRALHACCSELGIEHKNPHTAYGDAWAALHLLEHCMRQIEPRDLCDLGCDCSELAYDGWAPPSPTGCALLRSRAAVLRARDRGYLSRLVDKLPGTQGRTIREAEYLCSVDCALEDRRLLKSEADDLVAEANRLGMGLAEVRAAHEAFVWALAREAKADGVVTDHERRDLDLVCELLGVPTVSLDEILGGPAPAPRPPSEAPSALTGRTVCFTGELLGRRAGERITREVAEALAEERGLVVLPGVSKNLDVLVVADPGTQSRKAGKARECGTRVMAEAAFWKAIGVQVE